MLKGQTLRALVTERLAAAAEEIFVLFERTISEYEEKLCRSEEENQRKQLLLDKVLTPRIELVRGNFQIPSTRPGPDLNQETTKTPQIKEESEEEDKQLPVSVPESSVKTEESPLFQQRQTEDHQEPHFHLDTESRVELLCDTDNDDDWEPFRRPAAPELIQSLNAVTSAEIKVSQTCPSELADSVSGCEDDCVPDSEGDYLQIQTSRGGVDTCVGSWETTGSSCSYPCTVTSSTDTPTSVLPSPAKANQKKIFLQKQIKKQYCLFCKKPVAKLARHLGSVHKNEKDVSLALSFDKGSKKRRQMLDFLRNRGNFSHNATVASSGVGELVAIRRSGTSQSPDAFVHCKFCQGLYSRKSLWRHMKRSHMESVREVSAVARKGLYMLLPKPASVKEEVWKIACAMNDDEISAVVRSEGAILQLGESFYNLKHPQEHDTICRKMREMAKLLIEARAVTPLWSVEDLVSPTNFVHIIKAVKSASGYREERNAVPALALKLMNSLIQMAGIIHYNALIENRKDVAESAKKFGFLFKKKWSESVSSTASQKKGKTMDLLPLAQDVTCLHKFLSAKRAECIKTLEEEPNEKSFADLVKVTLTQVLLFNRRRESVVSRMELKSYTSRNDTELNPQISARLGKFETKLAERLERVEVKGNQDVQVLVLLTPDTTSALDLLLKKRGECQVPKENVYVFARPETLDFIRGSDCFRDFAAVCGAQRPEALTSASFVREVSALSTLLHLKDDHLEQLAAFLGRDAHVHKYSRLSESAQKLARVGKRLMATEKRMSPELEGKQAGNIPLNPEAQATTEKKTEAPEKGLKRRWQKWTQAEVKAVERHMMDFITRRRIPGKTSCNVCLQREPQTLRTRDWVDIKNYVYNRIKALKRK